MADIATLINVLRRDNPYTNRVILWGSGYGGTLAVMARQKYPHLIDGVNFEIISSIKSIVK